MRCTHCIEVPTLQFEKILTHVITTEDSTGLAIEVMAVDAVDDDGLAIDQELISIDFDATEANFLTCDLDDLT